MAHGDTQEATLRHVNQAMKLWIDTAREFGDPIPETKGKRHGHWVVRRRRTQTCDFPLTVPLRSLLLLSFLCGLGLGQSSGRIEGQVTLENNGQPVHFATVMVVELSKIAETDSEGKYALNLPPGAYSIIAYTSSLAAPSQVVEIRPGETQSLNFGLNISPLKHEITVTAKDAQQTAFEAVQSVTSLNSTDLTRRHAPGLGDVLDGAPGVAKRSFGAGSSRPVIRGFDGDRVLVMQDGIRVGSLASQSGDHGEPLDSTSLERLEILKGPATLLYGSNAVGGVVNAVSGHHEIHSQPHQGTRGKVSTVTGSANQHLGASVTAEHGTGKVLFWVGGGGQRTNDYDTPEGEVENSKSRISNAQAGFGFFGDKTFAGFGYNYNDGRYGIPVVVGFHGHEDEDHTEDAGMKKGEDPEAIEVEFRRHNVRFSGGVRNLNPWIEAFKLSLNYTDWGHQELAVFGGGNEFEVGTSFENRQFVYRGVFQQTQLGILSGSFGFWGLNREYDVAGAEALSPPVDQDAFAVFGLQELQFEGVKLQFGGRLERTSFRPQGPQVRGRGLAETGLTLPDRDFTGVSGGVGARFDLWKEGALVANFVSSHRSPALEELYNFGPHMGNLDFEIGDPNLERERSHGLAFSLRQSSKRIRAKANFFYYDIDQFVFLTPTGEIKEGLIEANYAQGNARFLGTELCLDFGVHDAVWINLGLDAVDAELSKTGESLPRIPPLRGRFGVDLRYQGFSLRPELVMANERRDIFGTETPTAGYTVVNLGASYTLPRRHFSHHFSLNLFNLGDRLYRNHVSFIKDLAPEMGRGLSVAYTMEFF